MKRTDEEEEGEGKGKGSEAIANVLKLFLIWRR